MDQDGQPRRAFDPEAVAAINRAYEGVLEAMGTQTAHSDLRAIAAKHIMDLAMGGETDETKLRDAAVAHLSVVKKPLIYTGL